MKLLTNLLAFLLALLIPGAASRAQDAAPSRPPNIVFLLADDLGYGDLGCYGHPYARTPNLDRLAAEGTRFEQFYVTGITCCPSRTGFMTGRFPATYPKYPADHGFGGRVTVTRLLKQRGYATGHFGKWHIGPDPEPSTYGIDVIAAGRPGPKSRRGARRGRDAGVYDAAIEFITKNRDRPFYVNVWGHVTHFPVNPPRRFAERFAGVHVEASEFGPAMAEKFAQLRELGADVDACMRNYLGDVSSLDDDVGRLLDALDELGLRDGTIVVFSSDHGPAPVEWARRKSRAGRADNAEYRSNMLGSAGPFRGGKHKMLEGGVRVPFIVRWPGRVRPGHVDRESVVSGVDWLPTLCAISGVKIDAGDFDGEDASAAWLGEATHARRKPLFWRVSNPGAPVGVRDGRWKLYDPRRRRGPVELYDVVSDPAEGRDLAKKRPEIVSSLRSKIAGWAATLPGAYVKPRKKQNEPIRAPLDESDRSLMAYVGTFSSPLGDVLPTQVDLPPGNGRGIHLFQVNRETGATTPAGVERMGTSPSCLVLNESGTRLYSSNETDRVAGSSDSGDREGSVSAFAVAPSDGQLTMLNTVRSGGDGPTYVSIHPSGRFLLVANYFGGSVAVLPILPDGRLGQPTDVENDRGTIGPTRAASAPPGSFAISGHDRTHAHMIQADPSGRFVLHVDLGLDRIFVWKFDERTGTLAPNEPHFVSLPPGDGPRHFSFHPAGRWLYSIQEEGSTVVLFDYDSMKGRLTSRQTISTLPAGFAGSNFCSEILVSRDGRFVYAGNRLHDSIGIFSIDSNGELELVGEEWTRGDYPRSFNFDPTGRFLFSCNQRCDNVAVFRVSRESGELEFTGHYAAVGNPSSIVFLDLAKKTVSSPPRSNAK